MVVLLSLIVACRSPWTSIHTHCQILDVHIVPRVGTGSWKFYSVTRFLPYNSVRFIIENDLEFAKIFVRIFLFRLKKMIFFSSSRAIQYNTIQYNPFTVCKKNWRSCLTPRCHLKNYLKNLKIIKMLYH